MTKPLYQQLAEAAAKSAITQRQLADQIGVSQPQINHWLTGRRKIPLHRADEIAHLCGYGVCVQLFRYR